MTWGTPRETAQRGTCGGGAEDPLSKCAVGPQGQRGLKTQPEHIPQRPQVLEPNDSSVTTDP